VKLINVKNKNNELISSNNKIENSFCDEFILININNGSWGKPERWVRAKELMENGNPEEPEHWMWHSEYYEDSDVLQTEERTRSYIVNELNELGHTVEVQKEEKETWVLLKADYTIEIIDLDADYDWLLSEVHRKRKAEYPPITELGDALYWKEQGNDSKYIEYIGKCEQVKTKYPLPIRSN
jgi:hypothetical protein